MLIAHGANVNHEDKKKLTALAFAKRASKLNVVAILESAGAEKVETEAQKKKEQAIRRKQEQQQYKEQARKKAM